MENVTHSVATFKDLELCLLKMVAGEFAERLEDVLRQLDERSERPSGQGWESVGRRARGLVSLLGVEIRFARHGYRRVRPDGNVEYRWPLDELLGLRPDERFCPLVQSMAIELAARMAFREAAGFLREQLQVAVSHEQVHRWMQEAGETRESEERELADAVFEHGQVLAGADGGAPLVVMEADGVWVHLQREKNRLAELKLGVMHEGWMAESPARKRFRLVKKAAWAGFLPEEKFWQRGVLRFCGRYDRRKVGRVIVNGDGAKWVKAVRNHLEGAEVYLDRFHRNQALRRGLGFAPGLLQEAQDALRAGNVQALGPVLTRATMQAMSAEHVQRIQELRRYLQANADGLLDWRQTEGSVPEAARGLGAAEGQINHVLARRMKKRGMSWRTAGAHRMALLRCLEAEGDLTAWVGGWVGQRWSQSEPPAGQTVVRQQVIEQLKQTDPSEWLQRHLPLLATASGSTDLGRNLRRLAGPETVWELKYAVQPAGWRQRILPPKTA